MYISFIGLRLTKTSLTLINRTRLGTIDPLKSIFSFGKKSQSMIDFFAIYCDLLRFFAIFPSENQIWHREKAEEGCKDLFPSWFPF